MLFELRPKTRFTYPGDALGVTRKVVAQARRNNPARLNVEVKENCLILRFPPATSEIWTPQMEVRLLSNADGTVDVKAIMGPRSSIWVLFRTALIIIACMGGIGLIVGFIQWTLGVSPWGFYMAVAGLSAGLFVWFLSEEGKRRARDEMGLLRTFMDDALACDHFAASEVRSRMIPGRVA
jgi:hypothetical protein